MDDKTLIETKKIYGGIVNVGPRRGKMMEINAAVASGDRFRREIAGTMGITTSFNLC